MPDNIRRLIAAPWFAATLLFIAVFAFYAHTAKFAFVDFDDNEYVFDNHDFIDYDVMKALLCRMTVGLFG